MITFTIRLSKQALSELIDLIKMYGGYTYKECYSYLNKVYKENR